MKKFLLIFIFIIPLSLADKGLITGSEFVRLSESAQSAIVAWNNGHELLLLSTKLQPESDFCGTSTYAECRSDEDCVVGGCFNSVCMGSYETGEFNGNCEWGECYNYTRYNAECKCVYGMCEWVTKAWGVELLPLPSKPNIEKGDPEAFLAVARLVSIFELEKGLKKKGMSIPVEVIETKRIGVHNLTVFHATDANSLFSFIQRYVESFGKLKIPLSLKQSIENYIERGFNYFVLDLVEVNSTVASVEPILYKFDSSYPFYPLEITASSDISSSTGLINIYLLLPRELNQSEIKQFEGFEFSTSLKLGKKELFSIGDRFANLFNSTANLYVLRYQGSFNSLKDLEIKSMKFGEVKQENVGFGKSILLLIVILVLLLIFRFKH